MFYLFKMVDVGKTVELGRMLDQLSISAGNASSALSRRLALVTLFVDTSLSWIVVVVILSCANCLFILSSPRHSLLLFIIAFSSYIVIIFPSCSPITSRSSWEIKLIKNMEIVKCPKYTQYRTYTNYNRRCILSKENCFRQKWVTMLMIMIDQCLFCDWRNRNIFISCTSHTGRALPNVHFLYL